MPDGLDPAAAAMAEPLAAAVHAIARAPDKQVAPDVGVLGGGPMGQMLAALLVAEGRTVTLADRHAERRAQAEATGAMSAERLADHDVVFEAVGPPGRLARRGRRPARPAAASCSSAAARPTATRACLRARFTTTSSTSAAPSTTPPRRSTARSRCWPREP